MVVVQRPHWRPGGASRRAEQLGRQREIARRIPRYPQKQIRIRPTFKNHQPISIKLTASFLSVHQKGTSPPC